MNTLRMGVTTYTNMFKNKPINKGVLEEVFWWGDFSSHIKYKTNIFHGNFVSNYIQK